MVDYQNWDRPQLGLQFQAKLFAQQSGQRGKGRANAFAGGPFQDAKIVGAGQAGLADYRPSECVGERSRQGRYRR
jgi:hypothetical protein